jgi:hypothetical protein
MANENDWNECDNWSDATMLGSTTLGGATPEYDGYGLVNAYSAVLLQPGVLYFSCQRGGNAFCDHCKFGQKIKVWVHEFRPPLPPPAPPTPCDQADNCKCSCCSADTCPGWPAADLVYVHLEFHATSPAQCTALECSSRFAECPAEGELPDPGANSPGRVNAVMPAAHLWSILFFFMLITLGLDSQYAMVETVITGVTDEFKSLRPYKSYILLGYCITGFLLGLPMTSPGGMYWFKLVEDYSAWLGFIILAFIMLIATWFLYSELVPVWTKNPKGRGRFLRDIRMMIGPEKSWFRKIFNIYAQAMWWFATPVLLMFVIVYACMNYGSGPALSYGYKAGTYVYPTGGVVISYMLNFCPQVIILVFAIVAIKKHGFKGAFTPTAKWRAQIGAQPKDRGHVSDDYVVSPDYKDTGFENKAME